MMVMLFGMSIIPSTALTKPAVAIDGTPITISSAYGTPYIDSANINGSILTSDADKAVFVQYGFSAL